MPGGRIHVRSIDYMGKAAYFNGPIRSQFLQLFLVIFAAFFVHAWPVFVIFVVFFVRTWLIFIIFAALAADRPFLHEACVEHGVHVEHGACGTC